MHLLQTRGTLMPSSKAADANLARFPESLTAFNAALKNILPTAQVDFDEPLNAEGEWVIDVRIGAVKITLAWRPNLGFGFYPEDAGYGARPREIYELPELAARRVDQLYVAKGGGDCGQAGIMLSDLRRLLQLMQNDVAERLGVRQTAVSRFETRNDILLSSLRDYASVLGGELEVSIRRPGQYDVVIGLCGQVAGKTMP